MQLFLLQLVLLEPPSIQQLCDPPQLSLLVCAPLQHVLLLLLYAPIRPFLLLYELLQPSYALMLLLHLLLF